MMYIDYQKHGALVVPSSIVPTMVFPGVRGRLRKEMQIDDETVLEKGAKVIIQPLNRDKTNEVPQFQLTVITPKKAKNDLPESQRRVKTTSIHTVSLDRPEDYLDFNDEQYDRSVQDLFEENSPNIEEIKQGRIPDCFFLAAINSILNQNEEQGKSFIRNMMRDNLDGTVTVRFFNPETKQPVFVKVEKSVLIAKGERLNRHDALWVHILEKAVSALPELFADVHDASTSSVLNGGSISRAMAILTGVPEVNYDIFEKDKFHAWDIANYFKDELNPIQKVLNIESNFDPDMLIQILAQTVGSKLSVFETIYPDNAPEKGIQLLRFYLENKEAWNQICLKHSKPELQLQALINHFSGEEHAAVCETLRQLNKFYYTPFSGIYSQEELSYFNRIQEALERGELVGAGTHNQFDEPVAGVRNWHAYSVLSVFDTLRPADNESEEMIPVKIIRLRNPWGRVGRLYLPNPENPEEINIVEVENASTFDVELKDFLTYYDHFSYTTGYEPLANFNYQREQLNEKLKQLFTDIDSDKGNDLDRLLDKSLACINELRETALGAASQINIEYQSQILNIITDNSVSVEKKAEKLENLIKEHGIYFFNLFQTDDVSMISATIQFGFIGSPTLEEINAFNEQLLLSEAQQHSIWDVFLVNHEKLINKKHQQVEKSIQFLNEIANAFNEFSKQPLTNNVAKSLILFNEMLREPKDIIQKYVAHIPEAQSALSLAAELNEKTNKLLSAHPEYKEIQDEIKANQENILAEDTRKLALMNMNALTELSQHFTEVNPTPQNEDEIDNFSLIIIINQLIDAFRQWVRTTFTNPNTGYERNRFFQSTDRRSEQAEKQEEHERKNPLP